MLVKNKFKKYCSGSISSSEESVAVIHAQQHGRGKEVLLFVLLHVLIHDQTYDRSGVPLTA